MIKGFENITNWVFDMDDTLYDATTYVFPEMGRLMRRWMVRELGIPENEVNDVRDRLWHTYGATMRGLIVEYDINPESFMAESHEIDVSPVPRDPLLVERIAKLPGKKYLFSNTTRFFGARVTEHIGVAPLLSGSFVIEDANYWPKPHAETYDVFLKKFNLDPKTCCFFEDSSANLKPAHDLGMATVWVKPRAEEGGALEYVHHRAPSLSEWLADHVG